MYWVVRSPPAFVTYIVPEPVSVPVAPEMTFAAAGVNVEPELTVNVPATEKLFAVETAPLVVSDENAKTPDAPTAMEPPVFIVIVPDDGERFALVPRVSAPPTLKFVDADAVTELPRVSPLNMSVPPILLIAAPVVERVTVPPEAVNVAPDATENFVPTEKLLDVVTVAPAAMEIVLSVSVPEFAIELPLFIVIVPAEGARVAPVPTVRAPATEKLLEVVTVAELAIVRPANVKVPGVAV